MDFAEWRLRRSCHACRRRLLEPYNVLSRFPAAGGTEHIPRSSISLCSTFGKLNDVLSAQQPQGARPLIISTIFVVGFTCAPTARRPADQ